MELLHDANQEQSGTGESALDTANWLSEELILALLKIPHEGIFGVHSALLFAREQEMCAYWWRTGHRHGATLVAPQTVKAALNTIPIDSGYLPAHTIRLGITRSGAHWMVVYLPACSYRIPIEQEDKSIQHIELGFPGAVFMGLSDSFWLWAVKDTHVSEETHLFHFPLPNVGGDGTMCFGENHPPKVAWPQILPAFYLFLESPFTNHWATGKSSRHQGDVRPYLCTLAQQEQAVFPEEELLPLHLSNQSRFLTLHALVQMIVKDR